MKTWLRDCIELQQSKMSIRTRKIRVSSLTVDTIRKDIKNIHLGVYPPDGYVRISAPLKTSDEKIRLLVISKMRWIKRQQRIFRNQERQERREYVSGESHYLLGRRYRLNVIDTDSKPKIEIKRKTHIDLHISKKSSIQKRESVFEKFYRSEMDKLVPSLIKKWQDKVGVKANEIRFRKMKTKWGTCNIDDKRIWLNLELAKKPRKCLDYVILHELVHLIEKNHSEKFMDVLESVMPNWSSVKDELNMYPLGYANWKCVVR